MRLILESKENGNLYRAIDKNGGTIDFMISSNVIIKQHIAFLKML